MKGKRLLMVGVVCLALIVAALPFMSACAKPAPEEQPLKVGLSMPMTGVAAEKGAVMGAAVLDCFKYINEELGGVNGHPIEVHWNDNGYDAARAATIVKKLMDEGCLMFSTASSKMMESSMAIANRAEFPGMPVFVSTKCVHPPAHIYGQMPGYDDDWTAYATWYMKEVWKGPGKPRMALHLLNNPTGYGAQMAAWAGAEGLGIEIIAEEEHTATTTSEMESLTRIKALNPDVLFISSTPAPTAIIVKNAYELGMWPGITIGCAHASFTKAFVDLVGADIAEGVQGVFPVVMFGEDVPGMAKVEEYCNKLHPKYYGNADYITSWVQGLILAEVCRLALDNCGYDKLAKGDVETWRCVEMNGFRKVKGFDPDGLMGPVDFSDDYDRRGAKSVRILEVKNGVITPISGWIEAKVIEYEKYPWFK